MNDPIHDTSANESSGAAQPPQPAADEPKKQSKNFIFFYVLALFLVALVLILLSYLTQVRADREVENLNSRLTEQVSATAGVQAKVGVLQETLEEQETQLDEQKRTLTIVSAYLGVSAEDLPDAAEKLARQSDVTNGLARAYASLLEEDLEAAKLTVVSLQQTYGATVLDGTDPETFLTEEQVHSYQVLLTAIANAEAANAG
jgi:septal ring factor EnvC (AmiA/AmiB activator)